LPKLAKIIINMQKVWGYLWLGVLILVLACNGGRSPMKDQTSYEKIRGNRYYGGVFNINESEYFHSLFPHEVIHAAGGRVADQIYEGLVRFNPLDLSIQPAIAKSWEKDTSGTIYTFKLREDVLFHDDECFETEEARRVTAQDFKYCFELLCRQHGNNAGFSQTFQDNVIGANRYYEASKDGKPEFDLEGVKVINDYTLQIHLNEPFAPFIYMLASPFTAVFPKEAYEKYGAKMRIGTGPFILEQLEPNKKVTLKRNPDYYRHDKFGNQLPYLDSVHVSFMPDKEQEVQAFNKGDLDMVYNLPTESIIRILETKKNAPEHKKYIKQRTPEMSVQYYEFLTSEGIFKDKRIRKAFNYAIDRSLIVNKVLEGEAYAPGSHGITPPTIKGYDVSQIEGYSLDTTKAKKLLAKAGYKNGEGFPEITLDVNSGGGMNIPVAEEIKRQLKQHLNIEITLNKLSLNQKIKKTKNGESRFWRSGWIADYPHPQNFLMLLYSKGVPETLDEPSFPNTSRYKNQEFDRLYQKGIHTNTIEKSYGYFLQAEQLAMREAPFIILWYEEGYRILQPYVRHFHNNAMQYRDYSKVWFDFEWKQNTSSQKSKGKRPTS
jgi:peptide/nickel transport system substrate-binding protein